MFFLYRILIASIVVDESDAAPVSKAQEEKGESVTTKRSKKQTDIRLPEDSPTTDTNETKRAKKAPKNPGEVKPKGRRLKLTAEEAEPQVAESTTTVKRRTRKAN